MPMPMPMPEADGSTICEHVALLRAIARVALVHDIDVGRLATFVDLYAHLSDVEPDKASIGFGAFVRDAVLLRSAAAIAERATGAPVDCPAPLIRP